MRIQIFKKLKELAKEHVCIIHRHRKQCDDCQRGARGAGQNWGMETSVIVSTI